MIRPRSLALAGVVLLAACLPSAPGQPLREPTPVVTRPEVTPSPAVFTGAISRIDRATREDMGGSWRPGCPVPISDLRLLSLSFWGFDGDVHTGELIVNRRYATDVVGVFRKLFRAGFPLQKMEIVHEYAGDVYTGQNDGPSDNDTAGFNCRSVLGSPGVWSEHAYGWAIDVNPIQNPYVSGSGEVLPREGRAYANRSRNRPGMIRPGGVVVRAFAAIGWEWGGDWHSFQDYMHFSATGR